MDDFAAESAVKNTVKASEQLRKRLLFKRSLRYV